MEVRVGQIIEANVTANTSFYKKVIGKVIGTRNGIIQIEATRVISKWSDEWKDHPTSCAMGVLPENILTVIG